MYDISLSLSVYVYVYIIAISYHIISCHIIRSTLYCYIIYMCIECFFDLAKGQTSRTPCGGKHNEVAK